MNRFRFRLEALLDMRKKKEEKIKLLLAEKNSSIIGAQKKINEIYHELQNFQQSEKEQRNKALNPMLLRYSISYRYKLKQDLTFAVRNKDTLKAEAVKIQNELIEAIKKRRAVEIIKERRLLEWKKEANLHEQNVIDEISQQSFIRKKHDLETYSEEK